MGVECRGCGAYLVRSTWVEMRGHLCPTCSGESLDAAWAEAEAALPDDTWELAVHRVRLTEVERRGGQYIAVGFMWIVPGPTPAAALRALAAKLREGPVSG